MKVLELSNYFTYATIHDARLAGFEENEMTIVSYGKHGLTMRQAESKNSFVIVPKPVRSKEENNE